VLPLNEPGQAVDAEKIELTAAKTELATPEANVPHTSSLDDVENRFAVHIVRGMWKLKAR
jgi:hypothetical protein